jgi:flagellar hook-basal body complex protein FliE
MIDGVSNNLSFGKVAGGGAVPAGPSSAAGTAGTSAGSFADVLKDSINEVARLQQDASRAVEDVVTGRSEDVIGVMTAMEKSDLAFKTLLAIRSKLLDAYDEIKSMPL